MSQAWNVRSSSGQLTLAKLREQLSSNLIPASITDALSSLSKNYVQTQTNGFQYNAKVKETSLSKQKKPIRKIAKTVRQSIAVDKEPKVMPRDEYHSNEEICADFMTIDDTEPTPLH